MTVGDCQRCPRTGVATFGGLCHSCTAVVEREEATRG